MNASKINISHLSISNRKEMIQIVRRLQEKINSLPLDGVFKIKNRFSTKMVDIYLKLQGSEKVLLLGGFSEENELCSVLIARIEEKPFLAEEKSLYIDIAVTKKGKEGMGYMSSLVKYTEKWAKEKKIKSIELRALYDNKEALEFWKKKGYFNFYIRFRKLT